MPEPTILLLKTHIRGYTKKDGTAVNPHEDKRPGAKAEPQVLFFAHSGGDVSKMSNNFPVGSTTGENVDAISANITRAALTEKRAQQFDELLRQLNTPGQIIKSRYAELRSDLGRLFEMAGEKEVSDPYLALDARPDWFTDVYYSRSSLASLKKCMKICAQHAGDPLADRALAFFKEWDPIVAKLDARKADVTTSTAQRAEKKETERRERAMIPPTKLSLLVKDAIEAHKPTVAADYADYITRLYGRMVSDLGPELKGVTSSRGWSKVYSNTLRPLMNSDRKLSEAAVRARAEQYAADVAEAMQGKIMGKSGDLASPEIRHMDGMDFRLKGELNGKKVVIEQRTIVNVSPLGTLFNQFPARIYVDGKFTSEAEYKTLQQQLSQPGRS